MGLMMGMEFDGKRFFVSKQCFVRRLARHWSDPWAVSVKVRATRLPLSRVLLFSPPKSWSHIGHMRDMSKTSNCSISAPKSFDVWGWTVICDIRITMLEMQRSVCPLIRALTYSFITAKASGIPQIRNLRYDPVNEVQVSCE